MRRSSSFRRAPFAAVSGMMLVAPVALAQHAKSTSPAAQPLPPSVSGQTFPPELVAAGRTRFGASCGFCHGPEATGGSSGPDLTRSAVVAADAQGDRIGTIVRAGRAEVGMPAFPALGDFAGVASRYEGLDHYRSPSFDRENDLFVVSAANAYGRYGWAGADYTVGSRGELRALDYATGEVRWRHDLYDAAASAGVLTTSAGVLFTGDSSHSVLYAFALPER